MTDIWQQPPADRPVPPPGYVQFGPLESDVITTDRASELLRYLREHYPNQFATAMGHVFSFARNGRKP
jgi:hypothetical protein